MIDNWILKMIWCHYLDVKKKKKKKKEIMSIQFLEKLVIKLFLEMLLILGKSFSL